MRGANSWLLAHPVLRGALTGLAVAAGIVLVGLVSDRGTDYVLAGVAVGVLVGTVFAITLRALSRQARPPRR